MTYQDKIYSYKPLKDKIERSYNQNSICLTGNTTARIIRKGEIAIRFHTTDIILIREDDTYQLFTGGWMTRTTTSRLNGFSPAHIKQKDYKLYLICDHGELIFREGMIVDRYGNLINTILPQNINTLKT